MNIVIINPFICPWRSSVLTPKARQTDLHHLTVVLCVLSIFNSLFSDHWSSGYQLRKKTFTSFLHDQYSFHVITFVQHRVCWYLIQSHFSYVWRFILQCYCYCPWTGVLGLVLHPRAFLPFNFNFSHYIYFFLWTGLFCHFCGQATSFDYYTFSRQAVGLMF